MARVVEGPFRYITGAQSSDGEFGVVLGDWARTPPNLHPGGVSTLFSGNTSGFRSYRGFDISKPFSLYSGSYVNGSRPVDVEVRTFEGGTVVTDIHSQYVRINTGLPSYAFQELTDVLECSAGGVSLRPLYAFKDEGGGNGTYLIIGFPVGTSLRFPIRNLRVTVRLLTRYTVSSGFGFGRPIIAGNFYYADFLAMASVSSEPTELAVGGYNFSATPIVQDFGNTGIPRFSTYHRVDFSYRRSSPLQGLKNINLGMIEFDMEKSGNSRISRFWFRVFLSTRFSQCDSDIRVSDRRGYTLIYNSGPGFDYVPGSTPSVKFRIIGGVLIAECIYKSVWAPGSNSLITAKLRIGEYAPSVKFHDSWGSSVSFENLKVIDGFPGFEHGGSGRAFCYRAYLKADIVVGG